MSDNLIAIKPMAGSIILEPIEEKAGLITVQIEEDKQIKGKILAIGKAVRNEWNTIIEPPENLEVGDIVLCRHWGHESYSENGKNFKVIKFLDIMAKIEK